MGDIRSGWFEVDREAPGCRGGEKVSLEDKVSMEGNRVSKDTSPSGMEDAGSGDFRTAIVT